MSVSIVIPVYNAIAHLERAVQSVLTLTTVSQIILIEDGSTDDSFAQCKLLAEQHDKIEYYQHPIGENLGAATSRNLGIQKAKSEYLAFLDVDDYYLSNRFENCLELLSQDDTLDGIYEPVGIEFQNETAAALFRKRSGNIKQMMFTPSANGPAAIVQYLQGSSGWVHLNGLTLRKSALEKIGSFDADLRQTQDTDFILRCLLCANFIGLEKGIVAIRTVHEGNRIHDWKKTAKAIHQLKYKWFQWNLTTTGTPTAIRLAIKKWTVRPARQELYYFFGWKNYLSRLFNSWKKG